jgi:hypothetical protein
LPAFSFLDLRTDVVERELAHERTGMSVRIP